MKKIIVIPNPYVKNKNEVLETIYARLKDKEVEVYDSPLNTKESYKELEEKLEHFDMIITLGGDGSMLKVAEKAALKKLPIMGINFGGVGYLTTLKKDELDKLSLLNEDRYSIEDRMMLDVKVIREGKETDFIALNDVALIKKEINIPIKVEVVQDEKVCEYFADGVVVASPTGSSAYSYSAGGPLLDVRSSEYVLTPICPVGRKSSYKVYGKEDVIRMRSIRGNRDEAVLSVDGGEPVAINSSSTVIVSTSKYKTRIIKL